MGNFLLLAGGFLNCLYVFLFFPALLIVNPCSASPEDPLYERMQRNAWIRKGDSLFLYRNDYGVAGEMYRKALEEIKNNDQELAALCKIKLGNVFTSLEDYPKSIDLLNEAKKMVDKSDDPDHYLLAEYNLYYGKYLLRNMILDSAALYIDRSTDLKKRFFSDNELSISENLFFRAELYDAMSQLEKSEGIYREIEQIYDDHLTEDHILYGRLYSYIGICLRKQLDYTNATDYINKSLRIFSLDSTNNLNRIANVTLYLASIYSMQNKHEEIFQPLENLYTLIQQNQQLERFLRYYYENLIPAYLQTDQLDKAQSSIQAYQNYIQPDESEDLYDIAYIHLIRGQYHLKRKKYPDAREQVEKAIALFSGPLQSPAEFSSCYQLLADLYLEQDLPDSSLKNYQKALIVYIENFENENIYANPEANDDPDQRQVFTILYGKANAFRKYYDLTGEISYLKEALHIYNLVDKLYDEARNSNLRDASLLILNEYFHREYERAIDCAYELFILTQAEAYLDSAFRLMEKNKSMLLFKSLSLAERSRSIKLPYSIKRHEDSLRMLNLDFEQKILHESLKENPDQAKIDKLKNQQFRSTQDLYNLKIRISKEYPAYYQIRYDSVVKNLDDLKKFCRERNITGIEYYWGDSVLYRIVTDGNRTGILKQTQDENLINALNSLLSILSGDIDLDLIKRDYQNYILNAYEAYERLLGDLTTLGYKNLNHLLIIPDGILAQLPFEALITVPVDAAYTDFANLPYLILNTSVEYAYSVNLLLNTQEKTREPDRNLLAFSYSGLNALGENFDRNTGNMELPHTAVELNAIKEVFPGKNEFYFDNHATEHVFKVNAPGFRILHLAVHGVADTENGENSRLIFKQGNDSIDDNNLYMYELYGMDLDATRLAVLSACETGIGKEFRGEGVFSMARGFMYAGCPTVIMSLWPVGDEYSANIMADFYEHLEKGSPASEALRYAKLNFIKKQDELSSHPANWASFVYLGEEFNYEPGSKMMLIFSVSGLFIIILLLIFIRYRSAG
jgi:CHAT domain-containing protein/tetratricopeptide (TPR) repeat protein